MAHPSSASQFAHREDENDLRFPSPVAAQYYTSRLLEA